MPTLLKFLIRIFWLIIIVLGIAIWNAGFVPSPVQAACYCQNPQNDSCRCTGTPPASAKNEAAIGKVAVICDTPGEADSIFAIKAPICGSSPEIIPYCAPYKDGSGNYSCYGRSFATGTTDTVILNANDNSWVQNVGSFKFNGVDFTAKDVYVCNANNFCCTPGSNNPGCDVAAVPSTPTSCTPQNPDAIPDASICGVLNVQNVDPGKTDSDARIYFPHVKNTSAITYLLQSLFRPISWTVDQIKDRVIYSRLEFHQGIDDNTKVINEINNNSSVIPGQPAPTPPFDFGFDPPPGSSGDGRCLITDTRTNPGDDLLGKQIYADLSYTQKYEYELKTGCAITGSPTDENGSGCCSGSAKCRTVVNPLTGSETQVGCKCAPDYISLPSKGKTLVYTKSPFLEYLYQNLVIGPAAIYKRFVSAVTAEEIKDISTKANIDVAAKPGQMLVADARTQSTSEIYFPHLGSIYDYFLKNLQKLLRPKDTADTTRISQIPPGTNNPPLSITDVNCGICNNPGVPQNLIRILEAAGQAYNVPGSLLLAILNNEGGLERYTWTETNVYEPVPNCDTQNVSTSQAMGPFQILPGTWAGHTNDVKINYPNLGRATSPCYLLDSAYAAAKILMTGHEGNVAGYPETNNQCAGVALNVDSPSEPSKTSCSWNQSDVVTAARQYLGYCEAEQTFCSFGTNNQCPDPQAGCSLVGNTQGPGCYQARTLANFTQWACTGPGSAITPPTNTSGGNSSTDPNTPSAFLVSGTPTQICQAIKFGVRQQSGTSRCIKCSQGEFVSSFDCPASIGAQNVCANKKDFEIVNLPNIPGETQNQCASCYGKNVLNISDCASIDQSQSCPSSPSGNSCYANNQSPGQTCEPQFCPNPGSPGRFCCYSPTQPVTCEFGRICSPTDTGNGCFAQSTGCIQGSVTGNFCCLQ